MDVVAQVAETSVARYDSLKGIYRIEVSCWGGEVHTVPCDDPSVPDLVMVAPMRSTVDFWNIVQYKGRTLIVAPDLSVAEYAAYHAGITPAGPMWLYLPTNRINDIAVVNLKSVP